ncbi:response regulator [Thermus tengchongensis]|uniref:hypothetical protein n=1 Tax=Thermus tengchongensis TaxID=1214928 RepID=UPI001F36FDF5|nr:hypothetical protein [Thermus tengchongensis]
MRVLIVDDSPQRYPALEAYVRSLGASEVVITLEVPEDLSNFDLVCLDYHLGADTALDALERLPPERLCGPRYLVHSTAGLEATMLEDWLRKQGLQVERLPYPLLPGRHRKGRTL